MKTPKGLKKVQSKKQSKALPLDLNKIMVFGDPWKVLSSYSSYAAMEKDPLYKGREIANDLCSSFASEVSGYGHFSDLYDSGSEYEQKDALKNSVPSYQESSETFDESDNVDFEKYNFYEQIKEGFGAKIVTSFKRDESILKNKSFKKFYDLAIKKKAFIGTEKEFLTALQASKQFSEYLASQLTYHTG